MKNYKAFRKELIADLAVAIEKKLSEVDKDGAEEARGRIQKSVKKLFEKFENGLAQGVAAGLRKGDLEPAAAKHVEAPASAAKVPAPASRAAKPATARKSATAAKPKRAAAGRKTKPAGKTVSRAAAAFDADGNPVKRGPGRPRRDVVDAAPVAASKGTGRAGRPRNADANGGQAQGENA